MLTYLELQEVKLLFFFKFEVGASYKLNIVPLNYGLLMTHQRKEHTLTDTRMSNM